MNSPFQVDYLQCAGFFLFLFHHDPDLEPYGRQECKAGSASDTLDMNELKKKMIKLIGNCFFRKRVGVQREFLYPLRKLHPYGCFEASRDVAEAPQTLNSSPDFPLPLSVS
jgi:hypothetical protein